ncbi:MAG: ABC transporter ATP-binding protein, partial [Patescibacteria group bacterium]
MLLKRVFYYYWQIIRNYKVPVISVLLFGGGRMLFGFITSGYVYKSIIDTLSQDIIPIKERYDIAMAYLIVLAISLLVAIIMPRWSEYTYFRFLSRAGKDIYDFCYKHLMNHSYSFFANNFTGGLVTRIKRFNQSFNTMNDVTLNTFLQLTVAIVLAIVSMYFQSKLLSLYFLAWCILYFIIVVIFSKQKIKLDLKAAEADSKITGFLSDSITNVLNVKVFSAFKKEFLSFQADTDEQRLRRMKSFTHYVIRITFQSLLMISFHSFILYTMINLWKDNIISVGIFVMVYIYLIAIFDRIWDLSHAINRFMEALTDAKEMTEILDKPIAIKDPQNPEEVKIKAGEIIFDNVSFEYIEDREVFERFNL